MTPAELSLRYLRENRLRTVLTIGAVAVAVVGFVIMRTFAWSWTVGVEAQAEDRITTRHQVTFFQPLPRRYYEDVANVDGVRASTYALWADARAPQDETQVFQALAVHVPTFRDVFDEMDVTQAEANAWKSNRQGALVGELLARNMGWKVGDRVRLVSGRYPDPGEWDFVIEGIYVASRKSLERNWFVFHYDYFNQTLPEAARDRVNWITSRITDAGSSAAISRTIDDRFSTRDDQTLTMTQRAAQQSFLGMVSAILSTFHVVSAVILGIMLLVLGNTLAMGVRSRTRQYAVLRALGFSPMQILSSVVLEGMTIGIAGGLLGLALAYPFVNSALGRFVEENMGGYFPYFYITPQLAVLALVVAGGVAAIGSLVPGRAVLSIDVAGALRKVD